MVIYSKKAHLFNIKRINFESKRNYQLSDILKYQDEDCYWNGFLMADGHINKKHNIEINLSKKDY